VSGDGSASQGARSARFLDDDLHRAYAEEMVGQRVGPYRLIGLLGQGGMGAVYEAEDARVRGRRVAVKILSESLGSRRAQARFELEVEALGRLRHPHVATLHDAGWRRRPAAPPQAYLVLELIDGERITDFATRRSLGVRERVRLFRQVCEAVGHAHRLGVIHRDLKPGNILVEPEGRVKVLDFGVARLVAGEGAPERTRATQTGEIVGTLPYMSPEQVAEEGAVVDAGSDVYSLGVVLYELLAGRRPYEVKTSSILAAARTIRESSPANLGSVDPALRGDLETIVGKALEKEPERRYETASDLGQDLRRWMEHEPISARAPSRAYRFRRFVRRNRALVAASTAVATVLLVATVVSGALAVQAERERVIADRRFEQVRGIAQAMMFDVHDAVEQLPGSLEARRLILERSLEYLESMDAESGGDPALAKDLAIGYVRVAEALDDWDGPAIHDFETAYRLYERVIELLDRPRFADDVEALRLLAKAQRQFVRSLPKEDEAHRERVSRHYHLALELLDRAIELAPDDVECRIIRIDTLRLLSSATYKFASLERGLPIAEQAIAESEALLKEHAENFQVRLAAARAHSMLLSLLYNGPFFPERMIRSADRIAELLRVEDPETSSTVAVSMAARTASSRALALAALGRFDEAEAAIAEGRRLARFLIDRDPLDATAIRALMTLEYTRGQNRIVRGRDESRPLSERIGHWRRAVEAFEAYRELIAYRRDEGLLPPWESHYPQMAEDLVSTASDQLHRLNGTVATSATSSPLDGVSEHDARDTLPQE
jgi:tetratricopeptide (TPR) repeat protein